MNEVQGKWYKQMTKKLTILEKIGNNTKFQLRFIQQRKLKGLLRLLDERAQYLQELAKLNYQINDSQSLLSKPGNETIKQIIFMIKAKEQEIISNNNQALEAAKVVRGHIIADLHRLRAHKKLNNSYDMRWVNFAGKQLNQNV